MLGQLLLLEKDQKHTDYVEHAGGCFYLLVMKALVFGHMPTFHHFTGTTDTQVLVDPTVHC